MAECSLHDVPDARGVSGGGSSPLTGVFDVRRYLPPGPGPEPGVFCPLAGIPAALGKEGSGGGPCGAAALPMPSDCAIAICCWAFCIACCCSTCCNPLHMSFATSARSGLVAVSSSKSCVCSQSPSCCCQTL